MKACWEFLERVQVTTARQQTGEPQPGLDYLKSGSLGPRQLVDSSWIGWLGTSNVLTEGLDAA